VQSGPGSNRLKSKTLIPRKGPIATSMVHATHPWWCGRCVDQRGQMSEDVENDPKSEFKELLSERLRDSVTSADLHRFLCARKYDLNAALVMIRSWETWYYDQPLAGQSQTPRMILNDIEDPMEDLHTRLCPISHMGEDKEGRPIYWEKSGLISGHFRELIEVLNVNDMLARHVRNCVSLSSSFLQLSCLTHSPLPFPSGALSMSHGLSLEEICM
jgi:hypothetical protein